MTWSFIIGWHKGLGLCQVPIAFVTSQSDFKKHQYYVPLNQIHIQKIMKIIYKYIIFFNNLIRSMALNKKYFEKLTYKYNILFIDTGCPEPRDYEIFSLNRLWRSTCRNSLRIVFELIIGNIISQVLISNALLVTRSMLLQRALAWTRQGFNADGEDVAVCQLALKSKQMLGKGGFVWEEAALLEYHQLSTWWYFSK